MKKILLILMLLMLLCSPVVAVETWLFDSGDSTNEVEMADNAALTLPAGDWTICFWVNFVNNTGSDANWFMSWDDGTDVLALLAYEDGHATKAEQIRLITVDAQGDNLEVETVSSPYSDAKLGVWQHITFVAEGTGTTADFTVYVNGVYDANNRTGDDIGAINATTPWVFGERANGSSQSKCYAAYFGKWDRALTQTEITALAGGCDPNSYTTDLKWAIPAIDATSNEQIVPITLTYGITQNVAGTGPTVASCAANGSMAAKVPFDKSGGKSNFKSGGKQ